MAKTGTHTGRAEAVDFAGMVAGVLAPIVLAAYVIAGAAYINAQPSSRGIGGRAYSHLSDTMSQLGDRGDRVGVWFTVVNVVIAVLLGLFTLSVHRRVPVGAVAMTLLVLATLATALIGVARCPNSCVAPPANGEPDPLSGIIHFGLALITAFAIVALPLAAWQQLPTDGLYRRLKPLSGRLFAGSAAAGSIVVLAMVLAQLDRRHLVGVAERLLWGAGYAWIVAVAITMFRFRRGRLNLAFDVTRLQENVIYGRSAATHGLLKGCAINDVAAFRHALTKALDSGVVRPELPRPLPTGGSRRRFTITVGFTHGGLQKLGVEYKWQSTTPDAFHKGMRKRADVLGDVGRSDPEHWQSSWKADDLHVLFWLLAVDEQGMRDAVAALQNLLGALSVRVNEPMRARNGKEPFGFVDGVSQPWIERVHPNEPRRFGGGKLVRRKRGLVWEPIALGEFILGETDEGDDVTPMPKPEEIFRGATFLVVRKLEQDVARFHRWSGEVAHAHPALRDDVEARLVGRYPDGTPLAWSRTRAGDPLNDFTFGADPEGFQCPMTAHVRRSNPRDGLGFDGVPAHRRRMIRRGMPYPDDDGEGEGLIFVAINARIEGQFEFVQSQWLNDGNPFRVGSAPDVIAGSWNGSRQVVIHHRDGPAVASLDRPFVRTRGGEYFVIPPMSGLWAIAQG